MDVNLGPSCTVIFSAHLCFKTPRLLLRLRLFLLLPPQHFLLASQPGDTDGTVILFLYLTASVVLLAC